ncbi:MAG: hypothetical protein QGD90_11060 [Candidatus Hydrogenedentes bacterium]|nr:hypothetical protein [Candidatus Hydrogenedentota bacterium]
MERLRSHGGPWERESLFLGLLFALPDPYGYFLWIPYGIVLPLAIIAGNRKQKKIGEEESRFADADA